MRVRVQLFAVARDLAGRSEVDVALDESATVADLRQALARQVTAMEPILPNCAVAVNAEYARDDTQLTATSDIALIPPVSGG